jgi:hypothetical protein
MNTKLQNQLLQLILKCNSADINFITTALEVWGVDIDPAHYDDGVSKLEHHLSDNISYKNIMEIIYSIAYYQIINNIHYSNELRNKIKHIFKHNESGFHFYVSYIDDG